MKIIGKIALLFIIIMKLTACGSSRPVQYLDGAFDTTQLSKYEIKEPVIQVGDLISIVVYSDNPDATLLYNLPNIGGPQGSSTTTGYLVNTDGDIQFQGIGKLHVTDLTRQQLIDLLNSKLSVFLKNPYYNIRFMNYKITLVGELTREGVYNIPNERVNVLEAIGLAGGLSIYARKENVMVIREHNGKREFARLDLTKPDVLNSPYYFLQQNDIVVVDQARNKSVVNDQITMRNISVATSIISTIALVYSIFKR